MSKYNLTQEQLDELLGMARDMDAAFAKLAQAKHDHELGRLGTSGATRVRAARKVANRSEGVLANALRRHGGKS